MNSTPLSEFIHIPKQNIGLPTLSPQCPQLNLSNEYGVCLFHDIERKRNFYQALYSKSTNLTIIECGVPTISAFADFSSSLIMSCSHHMHLIKILQEIPEDAYDDVSSRHLNTLIIENISAFFWNVSILPSQEKFAWYRKVNALLLRLKNMYGCNVIVTGWDIQYDRGFNSRKILEANPKSLNDLTYLPSELFQGSTLIIHYLEESLQFVNDEWQLIR